MQPFSCSRCLACVFHPAANTSIAAPKRLFEGAGEGATHYEYEREGHSWRTSEEYGAAPRKRVDAALREEAQQETARASDFKGRSQRAAGQMRASVNCSSACATGLYCWRVLLACAADLCY